MNAVEVNACWVEAINKENKNRTLKEDFSLNPKNLIVISEKPNNMKINYQKRRGGVENEEDTKENTNDDELEAKLNTLSAVPKTKYPIAMTSNQEIGWDLGEIEYTKHWSHTKKSCNETKYAADYVTMTKVSPYANKGPGK
eukprot:CAMPEP_0205806780 /NCGR_PEP_ID=MMETSP0205-20121125/10417_1 /ASSEMBLY_ACC=CAM_ASM_000278 /TAXON_ID=36767 /ORGANISM="Euplotes focardii, Strain TN1" /LENGTH=140 /DNA_ID=CAMNT_0053080167 /DNA_START=55 /DNA_END=477 /DNA_ORIENTATION=+